LISFKEVKTMNNAIVRSQHHHALLPSIGTFSALPSHNVLPTQRIGIGRIVAVCVESDTPLSVQTPNGAIFSIGGLSDRQKQQLLTLLPDLIHTRVRFQYSRQNELGQAVDAMFQTLLIEGDTRHRASSVVFNTGFNNMQGVQHG
jgi:hypothetical protein